MTFNNYGFGKLKFLVQEKSIYTNHFAEQAYMISHNGQRKIYVNPSYFDSNPSALDKTIETLICLVLLYAGYYLLASTLPPVWRATTSILVIYGG